MTGKAGRQPGGVGEPSLEPRHARRIERPELALARLELAREPEVLEAAERGEPLGRAAGGGVGLGLALGELGRGGPDLGVLERERDEAREQRDWREEGEGRDGGRAAAPTRRTGPPGPSAARRPERRP